MRKLALVGVIVTTCSGTLLGPVPAFAGGGCHSDRATDGAGVEVLMSRNCFEPSVLRAPSRATVRFVNDDPGDHTVTGLGRWGTGDREVGPEDVVEASFPRDGIYLYVCLFHPGMVGAVVVGDPEGPGAARGSVPKAAIVPEEPAEQPADDAVTTTTTATTASSAGLSLPAAIGMGAGGLVLGAAGFGLGRRRRRNG